MSEDSGGGQGPPPVPRIVEPTPEELEAARIAAIAENDRTVEAELKRRTRRGFISAGVAAAVGAGAWEWLRTRPRDAALAWPFRRMLEANESIAMAYFSRSRLSPTFSASRITNPSRINGGIGLTQNYDPENWRLTIEGVAGAPVVLTLDDVRSFPRRTMITELRCIEGWSIITQWAGARLSDVMAKFPPPHLPRYVALETPQRQYYVGLDIDSAVHPQTLLAYELNGAPLGWQHGAPLRLAIPVKYGIKNIKRVATIRYTDVRPADYWAEQGYDWYAGH
jgi:DMSO/TMAO reductase YedYZ molybdopterin-dependent catalytic subunit